MPSQTAPISHLSGRRVCGLEGAVPPPSTLDKETANWHIVMAYQKNLEAQVRVPGHAATAIPLWDELRIWDPGD